MAAIYNLVKEISDQTDKAIAKTKEKFPERLFTVEIQKAFWGSVYSAHAQGKKLIMTGPNGPTELIYALGGVPFNLDVIPVRVANMKDVASKYIDLAEQYLPGDMCGINKGDLGFILSGDLVDKPDAIIYTTHPCDSSRVVYPKVAEILGIPSYCIDTPYVKDERGLKYVADQMKEAAAFLEEVTGNKLDWNKFAEIIKRANEASTLIGKIAELRKNAPCPLAGRYMALNELFASLSGSQ